MLNLTDYHLHTRRCGHAEGEMEEYVEAAIGLGLREMGFSDHLPLVTERDPGYTMAEEEVPLYVKDVLRLQEEYRGEITIKLGIEADYFPGREQDTRKLLESYDWDYVFGSVHFIDGWGFDDPRKLQGWQSRDVDEVYHSYYELLRRSARCGLFDIIGHSDLPKKYGHRPRGDLSEEIEDTARTFHDTGMIMEINTAGLRKPVGEMFPALSILEVYARHDLPLLIGSDAHRPQDVGQGFAQALAAARQAGYRETVVLSRRNIVERLPLPQTPDPQQHPATGNAGRADDP